MKNNCQNCKKEFVVDEKDSLYYKKINVPHPTWCAECRAVRRLNSHNVWSVYWRNCDNCDKKILSMYSSEKPIQVYCNDCWWSDSWDGTEYAMDYDPNRNFLEQVYELSRRTPWVAQEVVAPSMMNSEYCNGASYLRNCYLTFWADYCENLNNSTICLNLKDSSDCLRGNNSELCYGSIGVENCFKTYFSEECSDCVDVWFSRNCYNCTNCIGCANLRGASYCIENVQYSKEEYLRKIEEYNFKSWSGLQSFKKEANKFWLSLPYRSYKGNSLNVDVTGDYIYESKNSFDMYMANGAEDSRYCQFITVPKAKDCYDYSGWGDGAQNVYEVHSSGEGVNNVKFSYCAYSESSNVEYSIWTVGGKDNFGCVNLKRKKYCILNKEYTKEEYEKLKSQIIEDMNKNPYIDKKGRVYKYGEFFPTDFSLFDYNETTAFKYFPKTKEQALAEGFTWGDEVEIKHNSTIEAKDLPEAIIETSEDILNEVVGCDDCGRGYKVGQLEFTLLQKMNLPIPHTCPKCRIRYLFSRLDPIKLWDRKCASCGMDIVTAFDPSRPEVIYCEKCYQQEIA